MHSWLFLLKSRMAACTHLFQHDVCCADFQQKCLIIPAFPVPQGNVVLQTTLDIYPAGVRFGVQIMCSSAICPVFKGVLLHDIPSVWCCSGMVPQSHSAASFLRGGTLQHWCHPKGAMLWAALFNSWYTVQPLSCIYCTWHAASSVLSGRCYGVSCVI
jgi:hypothetical protein